MFCTQSEGPVRDLKRGKCLVNLNQLLIITKYSSNVSVTAYIMQVSSYVSISCEDIFNIVDSMLY